MLAFKLKLAETYGRVRQTLIKHETHWKQPHIEAREAVR